MSGFVECVNHYYTEYDYNCSETIVHAANEYYGLGITEDDMRMFAGFGGGMFSGLICGALAASVAVLSKIAVKDKAGKSGRDVRPIISDLSIKKITVWRRSCFRQRSWRAASIK